MGCLPTGDNWISLAQLPLPTTVEIQGFHTRLEGVPQVVLQGQLLPGDPLGGSIFCRIKKGNQQDLIAIF